MSFRIRGKGYVMGADEKSYTTCIANFAYRISFLLAQKLNSTPVRRNDIV